MENSLGKLAPPDIFGTITGRPVNTFKMVKERKKKKKKLFWALAVLNATLCVSYCQFWIFI